jgi:hypothetical protein
VTAILATTAMVACGQDSNTNDASRSASAQTLADIPDYPKSVDRWGVTKRDDGLVTQSFLVRGAGRERIAVWFEENLGRRGWIGIGGVGTNGRLATRRLFTKGQAILKLAIATTPAQVPPFDEPTSKYSLFLYANGFPSFTTRQ